MAGFSPASRGVISVVPTGIGPAAAMAAMPRRRSDDRWNFIAVDWICDLNGVGIRAEGEWFCKAVRFVSFTAILWDFGKYPTYDYQDSITRYNRQRNDLLDGQMSETDPPPAAKSHGTYIHPLLTFTSPQRSQPPKPPGPSTSIFLLSDRHDYFPALFLRMFLQDSSRPGSSRLTRYSMVHTPSARQRCVV
ncbi:MAG: hypothetical protein HETSPECPRED_002870 [Heterodermia speciosa]|uniref:Uncharacterized protein n=1 Tax=Heterodermia speciosa TaxID=116794 RepID=A0A8H3J5W9_9LECA|nr:MAG: hypothetical protein HETSPECPRED_002870 [Heterodermia speciosa]